MTYDVIVVGLGAMGSATAYQLARRGMRVLGLDRFTPPHAFGSSHGETRIIREAYFEHPVYVPMVQRAYELWRDLEKESDTTLLRETGGVMIGRPDSELVKGARHSAELHGLRHEMLTASEVRKRFPALHPENDMVAVWEPRAGVLFPEACITAHLAQAQRYGAELHYEEPMLRWEPEVEVFRMFTARGEYRAATSGHHRRRMDQRSLSRIYRFASNARCCSGLIRKCFRDVHFRALPGSPMAIRWSPLFLRLSESRQRRKSRLPSRW